jgi:hypothetical protein
VLPRGTERGHARRDRTHAQNLFKIAIEAALFALSLIVIPMYFPEETAVKESMLKVSR